jgi:uncharacterized protein (DUF1501 family)
MNRKNFIRTGFALSPLLVSHPVFSRNSFLSSILQSQADNNKILVLIQLFGGNDGLNTIIPLDQYENLLKVRSSIMIPEKKVLALPDSDITAFHPSLSPLLDLYKDKKLSIIQGAGCPNQNYSHEISLDAKFTASDGAIHPNTGWLGRYINSKMPDFPNGYPNDKYTDPAIIRYRTISSKICLGTIDDVSVSINTIEEIDQMLLQKSKSNNKPIKNNPGLAFVNYIERQVETYAPMLKAAADRQQTLSKLYPKHMSNSLAEQLKNVARLIGGGLKTKIYLVNQLGYDTHASQVDKTDTTKGIHADLLDELSKALLAFQDDLELMGLSDRVLTMTYSDFGRRVMANSSYGTDHGSAEPIFILGKQLKGGLIGSNPYIPNDVKEGDNLEMGVDYRSVYASVLKGWFGASTKEINDSLMKQYPTIDMFR